MDYEESASLKGEGVVADAPVEVPARGATDTFSLTSEEAAAMQSVLEKLNDAAGQMVQSLDRMHLLMRDIVDELRAARHAA